MKYKLVVFDMDGTILNTIDDLADAANHICVENGFKTHSIEEYKYFVGNGIPKLVERFLPSDISKDEYNRILKDFIEYYEVNAARKTRPYDGIEKLLKDLRTAGVILAVNTNKVESAAVKLCKDYFPDLFDIVSGGKNGIPPKPAPDGLYEVLELAGISKEHAKEVAVFIGDSDVDILTGTNAGLDAIGVDWGFRGADFLKAHGAEKIAYTTKELFEMLTSE